MMGVNNNFKRLEAIITLYWTVNEKNILTCQEFPSAALKVKRKTVNKNKKSEFSFD